MIATSRNGSTVTDNMPGESYQAGIDDEDMAHVIGLFTDLYSDPIKAVIREYSTNALDAQIEAGYSGPIEVTLPSNLSPIFRVKDHGVGLNAEDIRRIYSRYGKSTKRATNDQNGMLGLGCKSALTYTEQFTVQSVCDGVRTICAISRSDDDVPVFKVVDTRGAAGEPNGTEVIVPCARNASEFVSKAAQFYAHWKPGTVLVNGKEPEQVDGLVAGNAIVYKGDGYGRPENLIVMGNVAYPITKEEFDPGLPYSYGVIVHVPIGAVNFTPSREALMYTKQTKATLQRALSNFRQDLQTAVQAKVDAAPDREEAIRVAEQWKNLVRRSALSGFSYRGQAFPDNIVGYCTLTSRASSKLGASSEEPSGLAASYIPQTIIVTGWDVDKFTGNHKRKLLQYATDNGIEWDDSQYFALTGLSSYSHPWVASKRVIKWEDVKAIKLPRPEYVKGSSGRIPGSYDLYIDREYHHGYPANDIDSTGTVLFFQGNSSQAYRTRQIAEGLFGDHTFVLLAMNRVEKFKRDFPSAKPATNAIRESWAAWSAKLTPDQRKALSVADSGDHSDFLNLAKGTTPISDPAIRESIRLAKINLTAVLEGRKLYSDYSQFIESGWSNPLTEDSYPLYDHSVARSQPDHVIMYLNAAYAANRQEA